MSTPMEKHDEKVEEISDMTSIENFKKVQNLEQWALSLEAKLNELSEIIDQMRRTK